MPITTEQKFNEALDYIAMQAAALAKVVLRRELPIDTLMVYAQSYTEHDFLTEAIRRRGREARFTHTTSLYVHPSDLVVRGNAIAFLGVRSPDMHRRGVGYADFPVDDYDAIKAARNPHLQEMISARGQDLLRVSHPDFDVFGFIVRATDHTMEQS